MVSRSCSQVAMPFVQSGLRGKGSMRQVALIRMFIGTLGAAGLAACSLEYFPEPGDASLTGGGGTSPAGSGGAAGSDVGAGGSNGSGGDGSGGASGASGAAGSGGAT